VRAGAIWSAAATFTGAVGALLVTPPLVRALGVGEFGLYILILGMMSLAALFDLGLPWAATRFFAADLARGHGDMLASRYRAASIFLFGAGVTAGAAAIALVPWIGRLAAVPRPETLRPTMLVGAASIVILFRVSLLQSLLRAAQRFGDVGRVALVTSVLLPLLSYLAVRWSPDVTSLLAANLAVNLVALLLLRAAVARHVPRALAPVVGRTSRVREMAGFSGWSSAGGLVTTLMLQIDRLCVAVFGSVGGLTYYAVPAQLASRVNLLGGVSASVFFSRVGSLHALDNLDELARQHAAARRLLAWLTLGVAAPIVTFGPTFLEVWIGPDMRAFGGSILVALVVGHALIGVTSIDAALVEGCGRPDLTAKATVGWAAAALVVGALTYPWLQAGAIAGAMTLWLAGVGVTTVMLARRVFHPWRGSARRLAAGAAGAGLLAVALHAALAPFIVGVVSALGIMLVCGGAILLWGSATVLTATDRHLLFARAVRQRLGSEAAAREAAA
jgi:O-antigen/teichoic acid export membrane protein